MKEFEHGGDINSFIKKLKIQKYELIDLSSNINFIKPKQNINLNITNISSYTNNENLYKRIAINYKVNTSEIELYNGASSAIFSLFRNLDLKACTIYSPAYLEYKKAASNFNYELNLINLLKNKTNLYSSSIKNNSLVVFVNPSTPDGKYHDLEKLIKFWISKNCTILIDESFLDFTNKKSALKYLKKYDKLYILKSMTKFYSCAGVRVGTLISNKNNIKKLKSYEPRWKISAFDEEYLIDILDDKWFKTYTKKQTKKNKKELINILNTYSFIKKIYPSNANFLLVKLENITSTKLQKKLEKSKIMIRDCSNFDFLNNKYVRIAVKSKNSINMLKQALDKI